MEGKRRTLYSEERECIRCERPDVHRHHIFYGTGRRDVSEREGCWAYLCGPHHNLSRHGVHFDHGYDEWLKKDCQRRWEIREIEECGIDCEEARRRFTLIFFKSYL
jgi:hypothetical protein